MLQIAFWYCNVDVTTRYQIDMTMNMSSGCLNTCSVLARTDFITGDGSLQTGEAIIYTGTTFNYVKLDNGLMALEGALNVGQADGRLKSIGHGFYGFGNKIFKFGKTNAIFEIASYIQEGAPRHFPGYSAMTAAVSDTQVINVLTSSFLEGSKIPDLIIRMYEVDDAENVTMTEKTAKLNLSVGTDVYFHNGYIVLYDSFDGCFLVDCRTANVLEQLSLPQHPHGVSGCWPELGFFDNGRHLGVFFRDNITGVKKLVYQVNIVEGKFEFVHLSYDANLICRGARKAFGNANRVNIKGSICQIENGLMHVNAPAEELLINDGRNDEFLFYYPTRSVLPIVGPRLDKDISVHGMLVSNDDAFVAVLVTVNSTRTHQLSIINTQSRGIEHFFINSTSTPALCCFSTENTAIVYTSVVGGTLLVVQQPIFRARLDALAVKLHGLMFGQLPLEIVMSIADYVDHDHRKHFLKNL